MLVVSALLRTSRFVILSCHWILRIDLRLCMWKCSSRSKFFLYKDQVSHPYERLLRMTALYSLSFVHCQMLCWFNTCDHKQPRAWLALQILALISLSREPSLGMTLSRYLKFSTVFNLNPSMEVEEGRTVYVVAGWSSTSVLPRLMVSPKR